ncbi:hypothetical protein MKX01_036966 [Papaver californicum]|nr:hypothetical protein MKX01_036966 [Papaver californicum]
MSKVLNFAIKELKHAAPSKIVKGLGTSLLIGYLVHTHLKLNFCLFKLLISSINSVLQNISLLRQKYIGRRKREEVVLEGYNCT